MQSTVVKSEGPILEVEMLLFHGPTIRVNLYILLNPATALLQSSNKAKIKV